LRARYMKTSDEYSGLDESHSSAGWGDAMGGGFRYSAAFRTPAKRLT